MQSCYSIYGVYSQYNQKVPVFDSVTPRLINLVYSGKHDEIL